MKSNALKTILNWVLAASLILSVIFLVQYFYRTRDVRTLQPQLQMDLINYQALHNSLNLLVSEATEYSKRDSGIVPILDSVKPKPASNAVPAAPTKPASR